MKSWVIEKEEKTFLRELAKKQLEYSQLPIMKEREKKWYEHNDLKGEVPMIHFETETFENEIIPDLKCTSEAARAIEKQIYKAILNHEMIGDDRIVSPWFDICWDIHFQLFDLEVKQEYSKDGMNRQIGHRFVHPVSDLHDDRHLIKPSVFSVDRERTLKWKAFVEDIFGDILLVRLNMSSLTACLSQKIVHFMGMERPSVT